MSDADLRIYAQYHRYRYDDDGEWQLEGNTVVYIRYIDGQQTRYTLESIQTALNNVYNTRSIYATNEAWCRQIERLEHGRSLFSINQSSVIQADNTSNQINATRSNQ